MSEKQRVANGDVEGRHYLDRKSRDIDRGYAWATMTIVTCNWYTCCIYFASYSVLYNEFVTVFDGSGTEIGGIISIYCLCLFGSGMFSNYAVTKFGEKATSIVSSAFSTVTFFLASFSRNLPTLCLCYAFTGIGVGLSLVAVSSNLQQHFDRKRSVASGFTSAGVSVGLLTGPLLARLFVDAYGWRGTLMLMSGFGMQNIWLCSLLRPVDLATSTGTLTTSDSSDAEDATAGDRPISRCCKTLFDPAVLLDLRFLLFGLANLCYNFGMVCSSLQIINKALQDDISKRAAALIPALSGAMSVFWCPLSGMIITAYQLNRIPIFGVSLVAVGVFYCCIGFFSTFWTLVLFMGLGSLCLATARINIHAVLVDIMGIEKFTSAVGALGVPTALGQLLAGSLSGWLYDVTGSFNVSFFAAGISEIIAGFIILSILLLKKDKTKFDSCEKLKLATDTVEDCKNLKLLKEMDEIRSVREKSELGSGWSLVGI